MLRWLVVVLVAGAAQAHTLSGGEAEDKKTPNWLKNPKSGWDISVGELQPIDAYQPTGVMPGALPITTDKRVDFFRQEKIAIPVWRKDRNPVNGQVLDGDRRTLITEPIVLQPKKEPLQQKYPAINYPSNRWRDMLASSPFSRAALLTGPPAPATPLGELPTPVHSFESALRYAMADFPPQPPGAGWGQGEWRAALLRGGNRGRR